jgi:hypothetical protein
MPRWTLGGGDVYRWAAANRRRSVLIKGHEWRGLPGLRRAMFGPNAQAQYIVWSTTLFHKVAGEEAIRLLVQASLHAAVFSTLTL